MLARPCRPPSARAPATHAPAELEEARRLLMQAKSNLDRGDYRAAREDAELSREKAMSRAPHRRISVRQQPPP